MKTPRLLCWIVAIAAWTTALLPLRVAGWLFLLYATHSAGWLLTLRVMSPPLLWAAAYTVFGLLYLRVPLVRKPLLLAVAVFAAVRLTSATTYVAHLSTLNVWHNVLAEGFWETIGATAMALAALVQQLALLLQSRNTHIR